jgi:large subunit ribosomal protein L13
MKTFSPRPRDIERRWYVVDAQGAVLGRLASEVAKILRGKHKPIFAPHMDTGDHVIVVNAGAVRVTGGKESEKVYYRHSGYPGGLREIGYERLLADRPVLAVEKAIRGMLPKNRLGRQMFRKLSVYEGAEHPHQAQKPSPLGLGEIPKWEGLPKVAPPPEPAAAGDGAARAKPKRAKAKGEEARPRRTSARRAAAGAKASTAKTRSSTGRRARGQAKRERAAGSKAKAKGGVKSKAKSASATARRSRSKEK